jgi:hypothetical protein
MGLAAYGLLEAGVHAIGQPAWLIEPQLAAERIVALPAGIPPLLLGVLGAVLAVAGLVFVLNAVLPGRRARHLLDSRGYGLVAGGNPDSDNGQAENGSAENGQAENGSAENGQAAGVGNSPSVVVDDEVIASALARSARLAANVMPEQVMVVVSQRQVVVSVRPTSGVPVDETSVLAAVQEELREMAPVPLPDVRVNVSTSGVIGA